MNRNNYERYLIDYLDGRLSALEVAELLLFLEQNPDIKEEFECMSGQTETAFSLDTFGNKQTLKKFSSSTLVTENNYTDFLIKRIERDLGELENSELDKFIGFYPPAQRDLLLFEKTVLQADTNIVFENKKALRRSARIVPLFYQYAAAAAVLIAVIALPFLLSSPEQQMAQNFSGNYPTIKIQRTNPAAVNTNTVAVILATTQKSKAVNPGKKEATVAVIPVPEKLNSLALNLIENKKEELLAVAPKKEDPGTESTLPSVIPSTVKSTADFPSLQELALAKIKRSSKDQVIEENGPEKTARKKFSAWDLAALTARVVNKATGNDIKLKKQYDTEGKLIEYGLVASNFEFSQSK